MSTHANTVSLLLQGSYHPEFVVFSKEIVRYQRKAARTEFVAASQFICGIQSVRLMEVNVELSEI